MQTQDEDERMSAGPEGVFHPAVLPKIQAASISAFQINHLAALGKSLPTTLSTTFKNNWLEMPAADETVT